jgi:hypothetical protein
LLAVVVVVVLLLLLLLVVVVVVVGRSVRVEAARRQRVGGSDGVMGLRSSEA